MDYSNLIKKRNFYTNNKSILKSEILEKIDKNFDIDFTHESTTIEGNTLTLREAKLVIEDNISIGGKELREIYEVINHNNAFSYVKKCIEKSEDLSEEKVKDIHQILTEKIMQGGIYRNTDVRITGAEHTPPTPNEMYKELLFFYDDLKVKEEQLNPIEMAAWTHAEFVKIHPFPDGNGRTSRLIMNYQLMKKGFLPVSIKPKDRLKYYEVLDNYAITGNLEDFTNLIYELEEQRLDEINKIINQELNSNITGQIN